MLNGVALTSQVMENDPVCLIPTEEAKRPLAVWTRKIRILVAKGIAKNWVSELLTMTEI